MQKRHFYKIFLFLVLVTAGNSSVGQNKFNYLSGLPATTSEGFYRITLAPAVVAKCNSDLSDLRLLNENDSEVSYILKSDHPSLTQGNFIEFPIISKPATQEKLSSVIIENKGDRTIDNLYLFIKNTSANRTVILSGSDDGKNWYVIRENITLDISTAPGADYFSYSLIFPKSTYRFFKIIISGEKLLPVNIIKTGIYETQAIIGQYEKLPLPALQQKDSNNKVSYVTVEFDDNYLMDELSIDVIGPKFFKRSLRIYTIENGIKRSLVSSLISSDNRKVYAVACKNRTIHIEIDNEDNPPLKLSTVTGYQLNRWLLAYLEPGKKYRLLFGDSLAIAPVYDLRFFNDSIHQIISSLVPGNIQKNIGQAVIQEKKTNNSKWLLWGSIILVLVILLILSTRLLKEMNKKSKI